MFGLCGSKTTSIPPVFSSLDKTFVQVFPPSAVRQWRQEVVKSRAAVEKAKKYEKVLEWAQEQRRLKPGLETERMVLERVLEAQKEVLGLSPSLAPPPREVKPSAP